jgi:hypothetical protein
MAGNDSHLVEVNHQFVVPVEGVQAMSQPTQRQKADNDSTEFCEDWH